MTHSGPQNAIPNVEQLIARRWFTASGGLVGELADGIGPEALFESLRGARQLLFLDSAAIDRAGESGEENAAAPRLGRYSFLAVDPIHSVVVEPAAGPDAGKTADTAAAFAGLQTLLADLACTTIPGLPPFQGGLAGLVSYECGLERIGVAAAPVSASGVPLLSFHAYDVVFAFDHDLGRGWVISQGVPARGPAARRARATERLEAVLSLLRPAERKSAPAATSAAPDLLPVGPAHPLAGHPDVVSTHTPDSYRSMVEAGIEYVRAGDIFQSNLAQRFTVFAPADAVSLHLRARQLNPAPFAAYFDADSCQIASMSPERLLQVVRGTVRMHPIKGTRRMTDKPEADLFAGDDLGGSEKDRAENVMIVDLVRNDLSRVCIPKSVRVEALCRLERYRYVQHLVSIVAGRLRPGLTAIDALDAALPGGSVTGAPKHRACEIITSLEGVARGGYCGTLGYVGFDGSADFNLLIRTFVVADGSVTFAAGGGITAASDPAAEYAESLHKAEGMLRVLASFRGEGR